MCLSRTAAIVAAALVAALVASPAGAAVKKKGTGWELPRYNTAPRTAVRGPRTAARIIVRPRSYLDAGTEVLPGDRKFTDYVIPPGYLSVSPTPPYRGGDIWVPNRWW